VTDAVGFVGLGVMGEAMCRNVVRRSGRRVIVFDIDRERVDRLATDGAIGATSVAEVAGAADIVLLSLPSAVQVEQVVAGPEGLLPSLRAGQLVVDHSTSPLSLTRQLAVRCQERGARFCDAPVARTRHAAIEGTLSIMVGGASDDVERVRPILECMASDITHCGDVGTGQVMKLMNNMVLVQNVVALAEALAIGTRAGIDGALLLDTLSKGSADSFALRNHGMKAMLPDEFPDDAFPTVYARKDLEYALELAADVHVAARGAELARTLLDETIAAGYEREYFPVLRRVVERSVEG
jgi:3-hydroxyisobutyrate dehydrogenase-like beta-hydroxyacid dehydrogenase